MSLWKNAPIDPAAHAALAANGLDYRLIDTADPAVLDPYLQAEMRGFLSGELTDEQVAAAREGIAARRVIGVYDPSSAHTAQPVGTVNSWITPLTLPGGRSVPMWAVSGVTVAPTHRRRGVARAMLEGELQTAAEAGVAIAGLTVSEATIYGRFGFSPATFASDWKIDTRRARWIGPRPAGRLDFLSRDRLPGELSDLHERVRSARPGEIEGWPTLWRRMAGLVPGQQNTDRLRAVRYADEQGRTRGLVVYRLSEEGEDFTQHELQVHYLLTETPEAAAALWRFLLEHDLVTTVVAALRSVDEPLRWMIADQRGARVTTSEHGWLRILDVPAALQARTYASAGSFTLRVTDPLGYAEGTWTLRVDDAGSAVVQVADAEPDVTLSVNALSSLLLGGVRARVLSDAGLLSADPEISTRVDAVFASAQVPYLSLWY